MRFVTRRWPRPPALDTRGLVRVDLRLDDAGRPWVLELNAIPGLTPASLAPMAARHAGWEMPQLCEAVADGLSRRRVRPAVGQFRVWPAWTGLEAGAA